MLNLYPQKGITRTQKKKKKCHTFCGRYFYLFILFISWLCFSSPVIAETQQTQPSQPSQPLRVIQDSGQTIDVTPLIGEPMTSVGLERALFNTFKNNEEKNPPISTVKILFPAVSHFSEGEVAKHPLAESHFKEAISSYAFYVMGDDDQSIAWAKKNAAYLKQIHAFGIVTNIQNEERLKAIEDETRLYLTTANLDGLTAETSHYPFLVYKGWVLQ